MMLSATLETLNSEHLGNIGYAPFSFLTEQGFAHYMPRIIELAITGAGNKHGDPFLIDIIFNLYPSGDFNRFKSYSDSQCKAILNALLYARDKYDSLLKETFYDDDIDIAIEYWQSRVT